MKLIDTDCCDLQVDRSTNTIWVVSGVGDITGHLKFDNKAPYIAWGVYLKFADGERSINAYWRGLGELGNFNQLKGKSIILTLDENPDEEDFGYYYNFHKGLHRLQIDILDIVGKEIQVYVRAHRNTEDDELDEDENLYDYIEGNFNISFEGIHIREYDYASSLNYLHHIEVKETLHKIIDVRDFNGPYYSIGEPYAKNGSCFFQWKGEVK